MQTLGKKIWVNTLILAGLSLATAAQAADPAGMEKCFGITKAGMNDCDAGLGPDSCNKSVIDQDPNYFIYVPIGTCNKIVGGMTNMGSGVSPGAGVPAAAPTAPAATAPAATAPTTSTAPATAAPATKPAEPATAPATAPNTTLTPSMTAPSATSNSSTSPTSSTGY